MKQAIRIGLWMSSVLVSACYGDRPAAPPQAAQPQAAPQVVAPAPQAAPAQQPAEQAPAAVAQAPVVAVQPPGTAAPAVAAPPGVIPTPAAPPRSPTDIHWTSAVAWKTWEEGLAQARAENRNMALLVYADWCPKCKALAPVFEDPQIQELTRGLVMVIADQDEKPAFLQERFADIGGYVPRLLFLRPDGTLRPEINSGHPRYPYFYNAQQRDTLATSLRAGSQG
ncbi:MAG: hypothetical protein AMXMBFR64_47240 [Myxococcales bacterium]